MRDSSRRQRAMQSQASPSARLPKRRSIVQRVLRAIPLWIVAATCLASSCGNPGSGPTVTLQGASGPVIVDVELAVTQAVQARGLMFRSDLAQNAGMLFVFPDNSPRSFWMKNTPLSLDILYIGEDRTIGHIAADTTPYSEKSIPSQGPARYVLEVHAGFTKRHGIKPGSKITLPDGLKAP